MHIQERLKKITPAMVDVNLKTTSGEPLTTRGIVVLQLTGTVQQLRINMNHWKKLEREFNNFINVNS